MLDAMANVRFRDGNVLFTSGQKVAFGCDPGGDTCCGESKADLPDTLQVDIVVEDGDCYCTALSGRYYLTKASAPPGVDENLIYQYYRVAFDEIIVCDPDDWWGQLVVNGMDARITCGNAYSQNPTWGGLIRIEVWMYEDPLVGWIGDGPYWSTTEAFDRPLPGRPCILYESRWEAVNMNGNRGCWWHSVYFDGSPAEAGCWVKFIA